jgi:hypothetical protein
MLRSARRARLEARMTARFRLMGKDRAASEECGVEGSGPATPSVSPTLQVRLGLRAPQLLDDRLDLGRIAEQPNTSADPAASLKA